MNVKLKDKVQSSSPQLHADGSPVFSWTTEVDRNNLSSYSSSSVIQVSGSPKILYSFEKMFFYIVSEAKIFTVAVTLKVLTRTWTEVDARGCK